MVAADRKWLSTPSYSWLFDNRLHPRQPLCNTWISSFNWSNPDPGQRPFRQPKSIEPRAVHADDNHPGVVSVDGADRGDEAVCLADLLRRLKGQGFIGSYDEVAILLPSVRGRHGDLYFDALRSSNIPVHRDRTENVFSPIGNRDNNTHNATSTRSQPADHVLLTTIHQAKGREWPVVCAPGLHVADLRTNEIDSQLGPHLPRTAAYSLGRAAEFDLARQYYVAFSRAQRLLILSAARNPHKIFRPAWRNGMPWENVNHSLLTGPGKFVAKEAHLSLASQPDTRKIVVPSSSTLLVRANSHRAPDLILQSP